MCGIAGFARHGSGGDLPSMATAARAMASAVAHRGPDGAGLHLEGPCALAHRRLAIVDLAGGAQPLSNEDGTIWITYNGEVYNHTVLRRELEARGHRFKTRCDTEAIVHAYEEWGPDCARRLRGMFAFAIWDGPRQELLLVRDRVGIKPLYYSHGHGGLSFASETKSLFVPELGELGLAPDAAVDREALDVHLALRYVPGTRTLWRGIQKLAPGHLLIYRPRDASLRLREYWDVPLDEWGGAAASEEDLADELAVRIDEAVSTRLMSEVPLGAFLSGGIDSSAVVASIGKLAGSGLRTYSIGYAGDGGDNQSELDYARLMATRARTLHREITLDASQLGELIPEVARALDEPVADAAAIPLYALARQAREEVTVVLSGEGADEVLGGYNIYAREMWLERAQAALPHAGAANPLLRALRERTENPRLRRLLRSAQLPFETRYTGVSRALDEDERAVLGLGAIEEATQDWLAPWHSRTRDLPLLARMLYLDIKTWLPDDLLVKADKVTMAHGLELRVPLLDHTLLEFCWRLPSRLKLRLGVGKYLLRKAVASRLPRAIVNRPKKGFPVPVDAWLRGPLYAMAHDLLLSSSTHVTAYLEPAGVKQLLEEHRARACHGDALYVLLMLELWERNRRGFAPKLRSVSREPAFATA